MADKKQWTVMVYLAGDNNLTDASVFAMTEMKKVALNDQVNIITQFDPNDDFLPTQRYHIGRQDTPDNIRPLLNDIIDTSEDGGFTEESAFADGHERVRIKARQKGEEAAIAEARSLAREEATKVAEQLALKGNGMARMARNLEFETLLLEQEQRTLRSNETDTGSPVTLYNFMSLCIQNFPAEHYMVVLSGHGSGTARDFLLKDDSPAGSLTFSELKEAFQQLRDELGGQQIDILGLDTCLMSMAEVAFELKDLAKVMISSESYSPASGWPYQQIVSSLNKAVDESVEQPALQQNVERRLATQIVDDYVNFYADYALGGLSVDQAALDLDQAATLREFVDRFADALTEELANDRPEFIDAMILAHWEAQSYNGELFVDLFDFCDCLLKRHKSDPVAARASELQRFIAEHFVLRSCYSGPVYQYSHGASIYFPWSRVDEEYKNLDFIDATGSAGWGRFLEAYTNRTRRAPRATDSNSPFFTRNRAVGARRFRQTQGKGPEGQNRIYSMRNPPVIAEPGKGCS
jgi:hypothetical protein